MVTRRHDRLSLRSRERARGEDHLDGHRLHAGARHAKRELPSDAVGELRFPRHEVGQPE